MSAGVRRRAELVWDGEAHLLDKEELLGKNPIGKRENVIRGIRLGLFGGHDKKWREK